MSAIFATVADRRPRAARGVFLIVNPRVVFRERPVGRRFHSFVVVTLGFLAVFIVVPRGSSYPSVSCDFSHLCLSCVGGQGRRLASLARASHPVRWEQTQDECQDTKGWIGGDGIKLYDEKNTQWTPVIR